MNYPQIKVNVKKLISILFISFVILGTGIINAKQVNAALVPTYDEYKQIYKNTQNGGPVNRETWVYGVGYDLIPAISDWLLCLYSCSGTKKTAAGGLQGGFAAVISSMYSTKPASGVQYIASLRNNLGFSTSVYAAGKGTSLLDNLVLIPWQRFRDVTYVFFVIVFVAIGFMIMFRFKINPQAVASVQDSLPKIAIGLIMVTLSYAIAGLIVDIAFVGNDLIKEIVTQGGGIFGSKATFDTKQIAGGAGPQSFPSAWPFDIINSFGGCKADGTCGVVGVVLDAFKKLFGGGGDLFTTLFGLILAFTVVGATFKIFFSLLTKYVTLVVLTMFLPFAFLWGTLPGQEDTTPKTLMAMISAALSFPAVTLFLALAYYFSQIATTSINEIPPLFYVDVFAKAAKAGEISSNLIAIGILTIIPNIPSVIDDALQVKGGGLGSGVQELGGAIKKLPIIGNFIG